MPRFKPKGVLERTAIADLWKHTLGRIPTFYGKLVYLASLCDPNTGAYRHYGLSTAFGREESGKALKESHEQVFAEWLALSLSEKTADLTNYLLELGESPSEVARHWLKSNQITHHAPNSVLAVERDLFQRDIETLLKIVRSGRGAGPRLPGSSQS